MVGPFPLSPDSEVPLYRQLYEQIAGRIRSGEFAHGFRLPATRELAGLLGLNRATVSAAYELLDTEGLISGQVGRGSYVIAEMGVASAFDWDSLLERSETAASGAAAGFGGEAISFVMSRPSQDLFPLQDFRASCAAVLGREDLAGILQLGSPSGYEPLRRHLIEDARRQGLASKRSTCWRACWCGREIRWWLKTRSTPGSRTWWPA
jgi:DNA-binding transcriptional MocR family regulator